MKIEKNFFLNLELVAEIEDYTFFKRRKSYNCISKEFLTCVYQKKKQEYKSLHNVKRYCNVLYKIKNYVTLKRLIVFLRKNDKLKILKKCMKYLSSSIYKSISQMVQDGKIKLKQYFRGYSTIEMQLIRILSYKKGLKVGKPDSKKELYLVLTRKIYEIIYTSIFFSGHKQYLNISKKKDYYRYYLAYIYLHTVQTNLNGQRFAPLDKVFEGIDVIDWPKEALFVVLLGVNNMKITNKRVDIYADIIKKYDLDRNTIYKLVKCIQK